MRSVLQLPLTAVAVSTVVVAHMAALVVLTSVTLAAETRSRAKAFAPARWRR